MRFGNVWFGMAGKFRCCSVRSGVDRFGMAGEAMFGGVRCVVAGYCGAVRGVDWFGRL